MKSLAIVIGLPALTIIVVSLLAMGGLARTVGLVVLFGSLVTAGYLFRRKRAAH